MKVLTAKNEYYEFSVDLEKNRFYSVFVKIWTHKEEVPGYLDDMKKTVEKLKPGFTSLCNAVVVRTAEVMKTGYIDFAKIQIESAKIADAHGQKLAAVVIKEGMLIEKMMIETMVKPLKKWKIFYSDEEAEKWLDQN